MTTFACDIKVLRQLAANYAEICRAPVQQERRRLWSSHLSMRHCNRPPVLLTFGPWNHWCKQLFDDRRLSCLDPFYRQYEKWLRMQIFHHSLGDDFICEPWLPLRAVFRHSDEQRETLWGLPLQKEMPSETGGAWKARPPLSDWRDLDRLRPPRQEIDEEATKAAAERLAEAVGDHLPVDVNRGPFLSNFGADISTTLAALRGLDQMMIDMYESPHQLHRLLALLRDGILANQDDAEACGHFSLSSQSNQCMPYAEEIEWPEPNSGPRKRNQLWGFCAAQEFTLVSPSFHEQFLFRYQLPIMEKYAFVHYGCCEDLSRKIDMLSLLPNLRIVAVTPVADIRRCAEHIGDRYVVSWRPNPAEMVCAAWDEQRIVTQLSAGLELLRECRCHIHLKDIEELHGDFDRLRRWTSLAIHVSEEAAAA